MPLRSDPTLRRSSSTGGPCAFGLALVQAAGGDPYLLEGLRQVAWEAYLAAGAPLGIDEDGMGAWWSVRLEAAQN
ncbi:MAG: hypothetical protein R3181_10425 [Rubricoccaceae bacterium]|nr:hypothetical protein [Rubricoccaceae bacterium]